MLAGGFNAYQGYKRQEKEDARQAELDARSAEEFQWRKERADAERRQRENELAIENAVTTTGKAGQVDNNGAAVTYEDASGQQKTAYQPDLEAANAAAQQQAIETGGPMPTAEKASSVRTLDGGRKLFTGLSAAQQAKAYADENAPGNYAKYMALSEKLATMAGGQELADKYLARAKQADKEGAFKALSLLNADRPEDALKVWNSTGAARLQDGQTFKTVTDKAGNKVHQVVDRDGKVLVPDAEAALVRHISGIEGVVSASNAKSAAAAKIREELYKPYTLKPGEKREVVDPGTGKTVTLSEGNIPAGYEVMTDPNGNTILRKIDGAGGRGTGTGAGKAPKEDIDTATTILKDALGKTDGTPEGAQRYTRAVSYLDGIYASNAGISPRTAAGIAADASANPAAIKMQLGADGRVSKVYSNPDFEGGRQFNLAPNSASVAEMEKSVGADGMKSAVTGMMSNMLAVVPEEQRAATQQQLVQVAGNPQARQAYLAAAKEAGKDVDTLSRQLDLISKYGMPTPPKTNKGGPTINWNGGMNYTPDPNSPAGRAAAKRAELNSANDKKQQERLASQQALSKQYQADKKTMAPEDLVRKYNDADLPTADLADLRRIKF
jgi:hypothetical protein